MNRIGADAYAAAAIVAAAISRRLLRHACFACYCRCCRCLCLERRHFAAMLDWLSPLPPLMPLFTFAAADTAIDCHFAAADAATPPLPYAARYIMRAQRHAIDARSARGASSRHHIACAAAMRRMSPHEISASRARVILITSRLHVTPPLMPLAYFRLLAKTYQRHIIVTLCMPCRCSYDDISPPYAATPLSWRRYVIHCCHGIDAATIYYYATTLRYAYIRHAAACRH